MEGLELRGEVDLEDQVQLPQDCTEDREAGEDGWGDKRVAVDADVECACCEDSVTLGVEEREGDPDHHGLRRSSVWGRGGW